MVRSRALGIASIGAPVGGLQYYYVDATDGDDSLDGRTPGRAWQTIGKVNGETFLSGDRILFKRGETWTEAVGLRTTSNGSVDAVITYGAYGSGALPVLRQANGVNTSYFCRCGHDYIRVENLDFDANGDNQAAGLGRCFVILYDTHHITFANCTFRNATRDDANAHGLSCYSSAADAALTIRNCLFQNNHSMSIFLDGTVNASILDNEIYAIGGGIGCVRSDVAQDPANITYRGNNVYTWGTGTDPSFAIGINTAGDNILIEDNYAVNPPSGIWDFFEFTFSGDATNVVITRNTIAADNTTGGYGIVVNSSNNGTATVTYNQVVGAPAPGIYLFGGSGICAYNLVDNCGKQGAAHRGGIVVASGDSGGIFVWTADGWQVYYNLVYDCAEGIKTYGEAVRITANTNIFNNTIYGAVEEAIRMESFATDTTIKNNIIMSTAELIEVEANSQPNIDVDYNLYYDDGAAKFLWGGVTYNFADWKTNSGQDANSPAVADPLFVDEATDDFHLQAGSPCRNVGIDVSLARDYDGVAVPQETNPAIGAHEYVA